MMASLRPIGAILLVACETRTVAPPRNVAPPPAADEVAIERVPGLAIDAYTRAARDCRPSTVARRRFAGTAVRTCGKIELTTDADWDSARDYTAVSRKLHPMIDCVAGAVAAGRPFIAEQQVAGTDSGVARGLVGVVEHGALAVYALYYDSNPCGGGCPERGHTTVVRCEAFARAAQAACAELTECFRCTTNEEASQVEDCVYGGPAP